MDQVGIAHVNDINISYRVSGEGELLVLIMGLSGDQSAWASQVKFFKPRYRVLTFDNRGVGKSDKPAGPYTTRMMADDTAALMDHLGIKAANVMGVSMGGMIAQELAINRPDLVSRLVLASTYSCIDEESNGPTDELRAASRVPQRNEVAALINLSFGKPLLRFLVVMRLRAFSLFTAASVRASNSIGFTAQSQACLTHNAVDRLSLIRAPTLVITGTADRVIKPTSSDTLARKIAGARLVRLPNGSHLCCVEMKDQFNQHVLGFLTQG